MYASMGLQARANEIWGEDKSAEYVSEILVEVELC